MLICVKRCPECDLFFPTTKGGQTFFLLIVFTKQNPVNAGVSTSVFFMKNPLENILQNRKFLWATIIVVPLILIIVILLLLNFNRIIGRTSDSEQMTKQENTEQQNQKTHTVASEEMLDREWVLIALEKRALKEKENEIIQNLTKINNRYQEIETKLESLREQKNKLDTINDEIQKEKLRIKKDKDDLKVEWEELGIEKDKQEKARQEAASQQQEEPLEDKIAKEKQLRKMAKGFETMRARDAAGILIKMLENDRENVLDLLRTMDTRTRTRILSAISRDSVITAADLTKELMEIQ